MVPLEPSNLIACQLFLAENLIILANNIYQANLTFNKYKSHYVQHHFVILVKCHGLYEWETSRIQRRVSKYFNDAAESNMKSSYAWSF